MSDFDRWFQRQGAPVAPPMPSLAEQLEDIGFDMHVDGSVYCQCCVCDRHICMTDYVTAEECLQQDSRRQYCGGSPRCCP